VIKLKLTNSFISNVGMVTSEFWILRNRFHFLDSVWWRAIKYLTTVLISFVALKQAILYYAIYYIFCTAFLFMFSSSVIYFLTW